MRAQTGKQAKEEELLHSVRKVAWHMLSASRPTLLPRPTANTSMAKSALLTDKNKPALPTFTRKTLNNYKSQQAY